MPEENPLEITLKELEAEKEKAFKKIDETKETFGVKKKAKEKVEINYMSAQRWLKMFYDYLDAPETVLLSDLESYWGSESYDLREASLHAVYHLSRIRDIPTETADGTVRSNL